jgi:dihydrofolate synthase/folylpolyglutamate synthase
LTVTAYRDLLARLVPARRFGIVLGLDRMRAILDRLGAPDRRLGSIVHVGGTNGKGSTVAMIAALVAAAGRRVATYTSPHLSTLRERIVIDGAMIGEDAIVEVAERVRAAGGDELTFFEQITAIGMLAIADARVDVTVLEVGLGGRLDATNVVDPAVAVVTGVALDHEAILGTTLDAIAREKAGIFKPHRPAIVGASGEPAAVPMLVALATQTCSPVVVIDAATIDALPTLGLEGAHQRANAAAAVAAVHALARRTGSRDDQRSPATAAGGVNVGDRSSALVVTPAVGPHGRSPLELAIGELLANPQRVAMALAGVRHPGRFERVGDVILDGAHNPHGARALAAAVGASRPVLVLAVSADKDVDAIVGALAGAVSAIVATRFQQTRAVEPNELARAIARIAPTLAVTAEPDLASALAHARRLGTPIVVAGSLFIVGEARVMLLGAEADPIWVSDPAPVSQP